MHPVKVPAEVRFEGRSHRSAVLVYLGVLAVAAATCAVVITREDGSVLSRAGAAAAARLPAHPETARQLLVALLAILLTSSALGLVCRKLRQPPVIGEIVAGICLGPSVLGRFAPSVQHYVVPAAVAPQLATLSQVGVILFMFLVGLELDLSVMQSRARATLAVSHASIVVPFVLGCLAATWLYPTLGTSTASFPVFALFVGVSLSVTAFPVLARILTDNALTRTPMGSVALSCAAIDDVTAWCLLALLVGVAKANAWDALTTCLSTVLYVVVLFWLVRPLVTRWARQQHLGVRLSRGAVIAVLIALLASALVTERIGIHAIFGAFLLGAIIPHDSVVASALRTKFHDLVVFLFLPAFYGLTGLKTELGLISGWGNWLTCLLIIALACLGKFGGSYFAARMVGIARREATGVAILMNTRGLMELVVLDLGLSLGVISPALFAMMVIMALVTTFLTSPLLRVTQTLSVQEAPAFEPVPEEAT
jgi:Kef-type K+ transport system membrane component KefB